MSDDKQELSSSKHDHPKIYELPLSPSSSILSTINRILSENQQEIHNSEDVSILHNYNIHHDHVMRKVGIEAQISADCLDKGSSITPTSYHLVASEGVMPGDDAVQIIDKRLGGPGNYCNVVPLNSKLDRTAWKDSEEVIYNHVKLSTHNTARMLFAFDYDDESENEFSRPIRMYYHFTLYDCCVQLVGNPIEGVINNISPRTK